MYRGYLLSSVLSLATYSAGTVAQICQPTLLGQTTQWTIHSQSQLDTISKQCTTLLGNVEIASNYTGPFTVSGVSNITGVLSAANTIGARNNITVVELPDVLYLGGISFLGTDTTAISILNATEIGTISLTGANATSFSAPLLQSAGDINLDGGFPELDLGQLTTVTSELNICSQPGCAPTQGPPLRVDLPGLQRASGMQIVGTIASLSMPELTQAYRDPSADDESILPGLYIGNYGDAVSIDLPSLTNVTGKLALSGAISQFSVPLLQSTEAAIEIDSSTSLDVYFHLMSASTIDLSGNISSAQFPALSSANSITIDSEDNIDCGSYEEAKERIQDAPGFNERGTGVFRCSGASPGNGVGDGMSPGAIAAVVFGAVASVAGLVCGLRWVNVWRTKKGTSAQSSTIDLQDQAQQRPRTPPPPYHPPPYTP
ncbi:hypothetical protein ATEIFO6365_0007035000 [Aspergillus terreus]|uniref:Uncharacterized protein n=1 Tax=Aspergillus terreus TaxID=33178 RepID=A0A5M3Z4N9_ASPTE|nr:hypothetical protein ATETN484_0009035000 [Aspergillus terreus]GFF17801.1 hypothetical protein ATEIFO6365_0007035000 [Aspergillus terreus]